MTGFAVKGLTGTMSSAWFPIQLLAWLEWGITENVIVCWPSNFVSA